MLHAAAMFIQDNVGKHLKVNKRGFCGILKSEGSETLQRAEETCVSRTYLRIKEFSFPSCNETKANSSLSFVTSLVFIPLPLMTQKLVIELGLKSKHETSG